MSDLEELDWAFTCPPSVRDQDLRDGYEILVRRFRSEGAHLHLNTAYQLLIERTTAFYMRVKQMERHKAGTSAGFADAKQEKEFNAFIQGALHEISDMFRKNHPNADRELVLAEMKEILLGVLRGIPDTAVREDMACRIASALERNGY